MYYIKMDINIIREKINFILENYQKPESLYILLDPEWYKENQMKMFYTTVEQYKILIDFEKLNTALARYYVTMGFNDS